MFVKQILTTAIVLIGIMACTRNKADLGSKDNPIKIHFLPSLEAKVLEDNSKIFKTFLEANTPYKYEFNVLQSYVAVVESFGTKKADMAILNSFGYLLAYERYGVEAKMLVLRHGSSTYQAQFIVAANSGIKKLHDLEGKKIAFVDPSSASGYILPLKTLKERNINPKETIFAMRHDAVVTKVYLGEVDAGATFYSPPLDGKIEDARRLVLTQYPDVEKKVKILELSEPIPNDPIVFRKEISESMKQQIVEALFKFIKTEEGKKAFKVTYGVTDLKLTSDAELEPIRKMMLQVGKSAQELMRK